MSRTRRRGGFRRRDALSVHTLHFGPNMTPMVDVVMVILIFFMASAAFIGDEWFLRAAIPFQAGRGASLDRPNDPLAPPPVRLDVVMDIGPDGSTTVTFLQLQNAPMEAFVARVAEFRQDPLAAELEVLIKASPKVPYRDVVRAHGAFDAAGVYKVGIGVAQAPAARP